MKRKGLIAIGFLIIVGLLVWANLRKGGGAASQASATQGPKTAPMVKVITVKQRDLTQTVLAPGLLEVPALREVRAAFATTRVHLLVGLGDKVTAGQPLAELESEDLRVQVVAQEAAKARAEAALAQLQQQRLTAPLELAQKLEAAKGQLLQAESALESTSRQPAAARQRLEQARSGLLAVQSRAASLADEVTPARQKLAAAEADLKANPTSGTARTAYDDARTAYEAALKRSAETARQVAADLEQSRQAVELAQQELDSYTGDDPVALRQSRQAVDSARLAVEIATRQAQSGGVLAEQVQSAEADLTAASASLDSLRQKLEQAVLKAPVNATVLSVGLKEGQPAAPGQLLLELGDLGTLSVRARVDEVDIGKLQPGQSLSVKSNAYPDQRFSGRVNRVAAQSLPADGRSGGASSAMYEIEGEVVNEGGKLRAGMNTETRITTDQKSGVLSVGLESVREEGEKASVLVVKDFKVEIRSVKLGMRTQTQVEVLDGLTGGEKVVVSPFTFIESAKNGDAVRVDPTEPEVGVDES